MHALNICISMKPAIICIIRLLSASLSLLLQVAVSCLLNLLQRIRVKGIQMSINSWNLKTDLMQVARRPINCTFENFVSSKQQFATVNICSDVCQIINLSVYVTSLINRTVSRAEGCCGVIARKCTRNNVISTNIFQNRESASTFNLLRA